MTNQRSLPNVSVVNVSWSTFDLATLAVRVLAAHAGRVVGNLEAGKLFQLYLFYDNCVACKCHPVTAALY